MSEKRQRLCDSEGVGGERERERERERAAIENLETKTTYRLPVAEEHLVLALKLHPKHHRAWHRFLARSCQNVFARYRGAHDVHGVWIPRAVASAY